MTKKKIFIIIGVVLAIVAMGLGVYFAWRKSRQILTPPAATISEERVEKSEKPQLPTPKLKIISDQTVFDYWIMTATTSEIFYLNQNGQILKIKEGEDEVISSEPIENLQSIKATSDGKQVLIKSGSFQPPQFTIFNVETKIQQPLSDITAADFSPDGKKIVYLGTNGSLAIKDLFGVKPKTTKILSINQKDFDLNWILPEKIILMPKPSAFYQTSAWIVDIKNKTIAPLISDVNGLMIKWSASGKLGLEFSSRLEGSERTLTLINDQWKVQAGLSFITLPNKCAISEPKIYCAIPQQEIPPKTALPDDYLKRAVYFKDLIYQIDVNQNAIAEVFTQAEPAIDAVNLSLFDNHLLFINRYDNKLYQLDL